LKKPTFEDVQELWEKYNAVSQQLLITLSTLAAVRIFLQKTHEYESLFEQLQREEKITPVPQDWKDVLGHLTQEVIKAKEKMLAMLELALHEHGTIGYGSLNDQKGDEGTTL
jgi:hypothetical protein